MNTYTPWFLGLALVGLNTAVLAQPVSNASVADIEKQLACLLLIH
jgi:hypothetical protein